MTDKKQKRIWEELGSMAKRIDALESSGKATKGMEYAMTLTRPSTECEPATASLIASANPQRDFRKEPKVGDKWKWDGSEREIIYISPSEVVVKYPGGQCSYTIPLYNKHHPIITDIRLSPDPPTKLETILATLDAIRKLLEVK